MVILVQGANRSGQKGGWNRLAFCEALATEDKACALVPGGGDCAHLQNPRARMFRACIDFLPQPSED